MRITVITVECQCGQPLFRYQKVGPGQLIKCYLPRILEDFVGIPARIESGELVSCPQCHERVGTIYGIRGVRAVKLNQGQIKPVHIC